MDIRKLMIGAGASQYQLMTFQTAALKGDFENLIRVVGRWVTLEVTD